MQANVGKNDKTLRLIVGLVLLILGIMYRSSTIGVIAGIVGIIVLLTSLFGFCPMYSILKISTCKKEEPKENIE
jgi:succinate-acetate transporter protein